MEYHGSAQEIWTHLPQLLSTLLNKISWNIMTYEIHMTHIDTVCLSPHSKNPYHSILHNIPQRTAHLAPFWVSEVLPGAERSTCPHWSCPVPPSASLDAARCGTSPWKAPAPAGMAPEMAARQALDPWVTLEPLKLTRTSIPIGTWWSYAISIPLYIPIPTIILIMDWLTSEMICKIRTFQPKTFQPIGDLLLHDHVAHSHFAILQPWGLSCGLFHLHSQSWIQQLPRQLFSVAFYICICMYGTKVKVYKSIKTTQGLPSLCLSVWPSCIRMNYTVQGWGHLSCYIGMQHVRTWHQVTTYWNINISNSYSIVKNQDTTSKSQVVQRPGLELVGMLMFKTINKNP